MQSIGRSIFTNRLITELLSNARLSAVQVNMLLDAGNSKVRDVASEHFPSHLDNIIVAYNDAITNVFVRYSDEVKIFSILLTFPITSVSCGRRERISIFTCYWNEMERYYQEHCGRASAK